MASKMVSLLKMKYLRSGLQLLCTVCSHQAEMNCCGVILYHLSGVFLKCALGSHVIGLRDQHFGSTLIHVQWLSVHLDCQEFESTE